MNFFLLKNPTQDQKNLFLEKKIKKLLYFDWAVCPGSGDGVVDKASSSDARGSGFEPSSIWTYHLFSTRPSGSLELGRGQPKFGMKLRLLKIKNT